MSIAQAEELKRKYTDKYVVVQDGIPELRRFSGLTGKVKTVNMNCRALVQFDGPADIAWYDIDPSFLRVVDAPVPKKAAGHAKAEAPPSAGAAKPAAKSAAGGKSPLEMARQQGAANAGGTPAAASPSGEKKLSPLELARKQGAARPDGPSASPLSGDGEKKLSPLELARQQGAVKKDGNAPAKQPTNSTAPPASSSDGGRKLSPLELARQQGAAKRDGETQAAASPVQQPVVAAKPAGASVAAAEAEPALAKPSGGRAPTPGSTAEIIALARQQGPFKG